MGIPQAQDSMKIRFALVVIRCCFMAVMLVAEAHGWKLNWTFSKQSPDTVVRSASCANEADILYRFFDEAYAANGYQYVYPEASKVAIAEGIAKNGEVSLQFDLVNDDYSGGSVCLYNVVYNLRPYVKKAALQFWIKGALGNEKAWVALVDDEKSDHRKTVVRLPIYYFGTITKEWSMISIPLEQFKKERSGMQSVYWDKKSRRELPDDFDWDKIAEFRIEIKKNDNATFRIWVDDIFIVKMGGK